MRELSRIFSYCAVLALFLGASAPIVSARYNYHPIIREAAGEGVKRSKLRLTYDPRCQLAIPRFPEFDLSHAIHYLVLDGLTRRGPSGKPELSLAERYQISPDGKAYTFFLREEAKWSDGKDLTAADVERSWKGLLKTPRGQRWQSLFRSKRPRNPYGTVSKNEPMIEAVGRKELHIELNYPHYKMEELAAHHDFFPRREYDFPWTEIDKVLEHMPQYHCGPFTTLSQEPTKIILKKNPLYWDEKSVQLEELEVHLCDDARKAQALFVNKEIDFLGFPFGNFNQNSFEKRGSISSSDQLFEQVSPITLWLETNTLHPLLKNVHLRRALSLALSRDKLAKRLKYPDLETPLTFLPSKNQVNGRYFQFNGDREGANEELQIALRELDLSREELEIELLSPEITHKSDKRDKLSLLSQSICNQWIEVLGIRARVTPVTPQLYLDRLVASEFQLAYFYWSTDKSEPFGFLQLFEEAKPARTHTNFTSWHNLNYTDLVQRSKEATSMRTREKLLAEAEAILHQELPIIPLFQKKRLWIQDKDLRGVLVYEPFVIDFKWAHFTSHNPPSPFRITPPS